MNHIIRYNAFISYSHAADDKFAPSLQNALQNFAKPWYKKRNLEIFRDESSLSASPHLWKTITEALDQSEYIILLASQKCEESKWVNKEIEYWLEHKSIDNLIIAVTDGAINWDNENSCFLSSSNNLLPAVLDDKFESEPFYIDLRQSKTENFLTLANPIFKKEVLKIAAKLHGMTPNDLASEEVTVHRKMMLLRNMTIILLIGLLVLTITALFSANKNRKMAEKNLTDFRELKKTSIGSEYKGGIIFQWNDASGKKGVIASKKDLPETYDWNKAQIECAKLSIGGYTDWRLPTREEIAVLYANRLIVGNFESEYYWSGTPGYIGDTTNAFFQSFKYGDRLTARKSKQMRVRPVRNF